MAKLKPNKPANAAENEDEATPVNAEASASEDSDEDVPEVETKPKKASAPAFSAKAGETEMPRVDVSQVDKNDEVVITMHETLDPAPRVGTFSIPEKLQIRALIQKKNYRLPKFVAEVIVDAGKAEYLQIS